MKRTIPYFRTIIGLLFVITSCSKDVDGPSTVKVNSVELEAETTTMVVGTTLQLTANVAPDNATNKKVAWTRSNPGTVEVDQNGLVKALAPGQATVTVTAADGSDAKNSILLTVIDNAAAITSFKIDGIEGTVDGTAISVILPKDSDQDITALAPAISHTGKSISPASGEPQDFTDPVTYTVTAENGDTREYTVTVHQIFEDSNAITSFLLNGTFGTINGNTITVTFGAAGNVDIARLTPTIGHTGKSISPASGEPQDFTDPVTYTVTAENGDTNQYIVTVFKESDDRNTITSFKINGSLGTINENTITVTFGVGSNVDITALAPEIEHTGKSISPASGAEQNFTNPVTYTVTAENGDTRKYTVTVFKESNDSNTITSFKINGVLGVIDGDESTITVAFGAGSNVDITALAPEIEHTGKSISPSSGAEQNFTNPVTYTVTAVDGDTREYTVSVSQPSNANAITSFNIQGVEGSIDGNKIVVTFPEGKIADITQLTPTIEHTGKVISPAGGEPQNFAVPVTYTVTAENGEEKQWTVEVKGTLSSGDFVTTWKGSTVLIPTNPDLTYNYQVDWNNDGIYDESGVSGNVVHYYDSEEAHTIRISGNFPAITLAVDNNSNLNYIIRSVDQWGAIQWQSFKYAFAKCPNLKITATDSPDLSKVTNMRSMFENTDVANPDVSQWDTSHVTDMSYMFSLAMVANPDVSQWDTSHVTDMRDMFAFTESANPDVSNWDTSQVTNMGYMFNGALDANPDVSHWDIGKVLNMTNIFNHNAISRANYEKALIRFAQHVSSQPSVPLNIFTVNAHYCSDEAVAAKQVLTSNSWNIFDLGRDCN